MEQLQGGNFPGRENSTEQSQKDIDQGGVFPGGQNGGAQSGAIPEGQNGTAQSGAIPEGQNGTAQNGGFPGSLHARGQNGPGELNSTTISSNTSILLWVILVAILAGAITFALKFRKNY